MTVSVMVFTRDLRLADNPALAAAARAPAMVPLFVLDEAILRRASAHANRLGFLLDSLRDLDSGLRNAGGALVLRAGPWAETVLAAEMSARPGGGAFVRQLAWRDFFHQALAARPDAAWRDYRDRGGHWRDDPEALAAWQEGRTGYPAVDAAMRQLAGEGFLPNRARMIAASFLTNDLGVDWRAGAAHFMRHLVDADVACNQLNWQWVAGTGTDTNRHRIFNPARQGKRFDPAGGYIRRWVPELAGLPAPDIHDPGPAARRARGYPEPIVDHRQAMAAHRARRAAR